VHALGELRVEAVRENLRTISYFLHGVARRLDLTEDTLFEIEVAVEEAAVNIVSHAYPRGETGDIVIRVDLLDEVLHISLADWGTPLDPDKVRPFDLDAPVETRVEGGMGLHLISNLVDQVIRKASSSPGQPNELTLIKRIKRLEPGVLRPSTVRELHAMRTVSEFMVSGRDLEELLRVIINELVQTIGAERGAIFLIDEQTKELVSRVLVEDEGVLREIRVEIGEGIAGYVAATGEVLNIEDAYQDRRFQRGIDEMTGFRTGSVLTAPMRNPQGKSIGVVQLRSVYSPRRTSVDGDDGAGCDQY
jgi:anti-sigma regulatory factor (Ser/Thr protein kinase)